MELQSLGLVLGFMCVLYAEEMFKNFTELFVT